MAWWNYHQIVSITKKQLLKTLWSLVFLIFSCFSVKSKNLTMFYILKCLFLFYITLWNKTSFYLIFSPLLNSQVSFLFSQVFHFPECHVISWNQPLQWNETVPHVWKKCWLLYKVLDLNNKLNYMGLNVKSNWNSRKCLWISLHLRQTLTLG